MFGIFLDIEASGLNAKKHRALEIALKIIDLPSGRFVDSYESIIKQPRDVWERSSKESLQINGITWEKTLQGKPEEEVAAELIALFLRLGIHRKNAAFICQNPSFDRAFFSQLIDPDVQEAYGWPYHWLDLASMHWAIGMQGNGPLPWETGLSKDKIAARYGLAPENKPHSATNGVDHLIACYQAVVGFM